MPPRISTKTSPSRRWYRRGELPYRDPVPARGLPLVAILAQTCSLRAYALCIHKSGMRHDWVEVNPCHDVPRNRKRPKRGVVTKAQSDSPHSVLGHGAALEAVYRKALRTKPVR